MTDSSMMNGLNAVMFFAIAKDSFEKINSFPLGRETHALTAIIFSIVSLECFVNEIGTLAKAHVDSDIPRKPEFLVKLGDKMEEWENEKVSLEEKLLDAKEILTNKNFNRGTEIFQNFKLLLQLRNALVHFKGEEFRWTQDPSGKPVFTLLSPAKKVLDGLKSRNILKFDPQPSDQTPSDRQVGLIELVGTPEVAKWACNTVVEIVDSMADFPEDSSENFLILIKWYSCLFKKLLKNPQNQISHRSED